MRTVQRLAFLLACITYISWPCRAGAETWRVALDGSGDTQSLNEACQAATSGDTILIAPGEYTTLVDHDDGFTERKVIAAIEGAKSLVIIGDSRESVVLGPIEYEFVSPDSPVGLLWHSTGELVLRGVSVRNLYRGLRAQVGNVIVANCDFDGNVGGVFASYLTSGLKLANSRIQNLGGNGAGISEYSMFVQNIDSCSIDSCTFIDGGRIDFENVEYVSIRDSDITGVNLEASDCKGLIEACRSNHQVWIERTNGGSFILRGNHIRTTGLGVYYNLVVWGSSNVELYGNIVDGTEEGSINLGYGASVVGSGNHILNIGSPHSVVLAGYAPDNAASIDLRNNWWGLPDSTAIPAMIWDGNDDPSIHAVVEYLPIAPGPVPEEKTSLGGLKALFR